MPSVHNMGSEIFMEQKFQSKVRINTGLKLYVT